MVRISADKSATSIRVNRYLREASAIKLLVVLVVLLLVIELSINLLLNIFAPNLPIAFAAVFESLILLVCLFPTLYLFAFRPLTMQIARLNEMESSLRESESTFMALLNSLNESACLLATDGTVITINHTAAERIGKESDQIVGTSLYDHFSPEIAEFRKSQIDQAVRSRRGLRFQDERDNRFFDVTVFPILNNEGDVSKLAVFAFDTTKYREAELQLKSNALALERSNNEIRLLGKMSETLQSCHTLEEAYDVLSKFANQLFPEDSGALYILDAVQDQLDMVSYWGDFWISSDVLKPEDCWGMRRGRLHVFRDVMVDVQCPHQAESGDFHYYCLPLMARSETLGLLHLRMPIPRNDISGRVMQEAKEQLLVSMGEHMALAIANLRLRDLLHNLSTRDPLTGVFNRRFMEESLNREISQADRKRSHVGIIMLDIDHFKRFNDTYGHDAGDILLREVGTTMKEQVRAGDIVCRYGGEEFIVIMPGAGGPETVQRAEKLRESIKNKRIANGVGTLDPVTASMGVSVYPENGSVPSTLLKAADDALYRAKDSGRDRVCRAGE
jgi:diguanylate cyclase (GGDEF)-like protein/PAS domain S-box-containing protein